MGLLLVASYTKGISAMYGSTQGEVFFKAQSSVRVEAEEHIVLWMGKFMSLQCLCIFEVFLPWSSPRGAAPAAATPTSTGQGGATVSPFWLQLWLRQQSWHIPMSPGGERV